MRTTALAFFFAFFGVLAVAAPAQADLIGEWRTTEAETFQGPGCGATSTKVLEEFPRGAYDLEPVDPAVGTKLKDGDGNTVATITRVDPNDPSAARRTVSYTATGTDAACAGPGRAWETYPVNLHVDYKTKERAYVSSDCFIPGRFKPSLLIVFCGSDYGDFTVRKLRWQRWNDKAARGTGLARVNVCPGCRRAVRRSYRVAIRLYAPRMCEDSGQFQYKRLSWRFVGRKPPHLPRAKTVRHPCGDNGEDTGDEL